MAEVNEPDWLRGPQPDDAPSEDERMSTATPQPTDEQLLAFEKKHHRHTPAKEHAIATDLHITPSRYYQLLGRLIWLEEALAIDPMLTNRLRRQSRDRLAEFDRRLAR